MESRKRNGLILIIIGVIFILINAFVVYPYINCSFAPLTFWLLALIGGVGGILLLFDVKLFYSDED
ncbi:MAG: hypothetical protein ACFE9I_04620 [Candidatus Hermodarchaeota archaeon]